MPLAARFDLFHSFSRCSVSFLLRVAFACVSVLRSQFATERLFLLFGLLAFIHFTNIFIKLLSLPEAAVEAARLASTCLFIARLFQNV